MSRCACCSSLCSSRATNGTLSAFDEKPAARAAVAPEQYVLLHAHAAEQRKILEGAANAQVGDAVTRQALERLTIEHDRAALEVVQPGQAVEQRRLSGAVGADQADDLARVHVEGNAVEGDDTAEAHADVQDGQKRNVASAQQRGRARRIPCDRRLGSRE